MVSSALIALTIIVVVLSSQEDSQRRKFIDNSADPEVPEGEEDFDWSFCNKKFRIVTYAKTPFIVIDQSKCEQDARLRRRNFVTKTIPSGQATKSRARLTRANRPVHNLTTHVRPTHRS